MQSQCEQETSPDAFRILGLPRRPYLEADQIKQCYLKAIKAAHPDNTQSAPSNEATEINQAQKTLENEADRIAHLLHLETGEDIRQDRNVPETLIDLFMRLSPALNEADQLQAAIKTEATPILKAQLFLKASPLLSTLSEFQNEINHALAETHSTLKTVDESWPHSDTTEAKTAYNKLKEIYRHLSFLQRWQTKLMATSFELTPA